MKSIYSTLYCLLLLGNVMNAQVSLPYYSGFDTPDERNGWTIYRLEDAAIANWSIAMVGGFSAPASVSHDYSPSSGANVVDDWFVSPGFLLPAGGVLDSVRYAFSGFSVPAAGDTIGVYILLGDQDPAAASDIIELAEFRDADYQPDNVYRLLSGIALPATNEMVFIGLRYRNAEASSRWLHVRFDNIAVSGLTTSTAWPHASRLMTVYPNPTTEEVTISHNEIEGLARLYDHTGRLIDKVPLMQGRMSTSVSLRGLPQGIYRIVLQQANTIESVMITRL